MVNKGVTWKSSNASIATVDNEGKVIALKAGTATITVTTADGSKTANCIVTVINGISDNTDITNKFTNSRFKTKVYSVIKKVSSAPILYSDVKNIKSLDLSTLGISNLSGIEYFTALTSFDCSYNQLTTLDLSKNIALTSLRGNNNQLIALDISKNIALVTLCFSCNKLTTLDLSKNTALTRLWCDSNNLIALDVSKNTALNYLDCDFNNLTTLDISKNILTNLDCEYNQLTTLYAAYINTWDTYDYSHQYTDSTHTTTTDSLS